MHLQELEGKSNDLDQFTVEVDRDISNHLAFTASQEPPFFAQYFISMVLINLVEPALLNIGSNQQGKFIAQFIAFSFSFYI